MRPRECPDSTAGISHLWVPPQSCQETMFDILPPELATPSEVKYVLAHAMPTGLGIGSAGLGSPLSELPWEEAKQTILLIVCTIPMTAELHFHYGAAEFLVEPVLEGRIKQVAVYYDGVRLSGRLYLYT
ncbi:uncharacterized protein ARMOST_21935 [Armillaria ostoyae]|uniref:Uncharacterized protein n=1 Tax=Armillaria ostoyae TaxID=47428 RepID=A0A284SBG0_ARMOS|nr:uncharacterized protein ARMOST_21935 [Armillaria ostoyae]